MKFSKKLQEFSDSRYAEHYIAYKDLKKAIKLITGADTSTCTIQDVTSNFSNIRALAGSLYRPPESRFQDLLNYELDKINRFSSLTYHSIQGTLRQARRDLESWDLESRDLPTTLKAVLDLQAEEVIFLDSYRRLNFTGFRKITKKYDKNNRSSAASWYIARLVKEPFVNVDFEELLTLLSDGYALYRQKLPRAVHIVGADKRAQCLVQQDDIMRVKVQILKHVPLLSVGRVSLLYFDTPKFDVCQKILSSEDSSGLLVCTLTGTKTTLQVLPTETAVPIETKELQDLMDKQSVDKWAEEHKRNPQAAEWRRLMNQAVDGIQNSKMRPVLQTWTSRTAFRGEAEEVCFVLDENISFTGCRSQQTDNNPFLSLTDRVVSEDVESVAWGVLELNIRSADCSYLKQITGLASVTEVYGFSLFAHCCTLAHQLQSVPHWMHFTRRLEEEEEKAGAKESVAKQVISGSVDILHRSRIAHEQEASMQEYASEYGSGEHEYVTSSRYSQSNIVSPRFASEGHAPLSGTSPYLRATPSSLPQSRQLPPAPLIPELNSNDKPFRDLAEPLLADVAVEEDSRPTLVAGRTEAEVRRNGTGGNATNADPEGWRIGRRSRDELGTAERYRARGVTEEASRREVVATQDHRRRFGASPWCSECFWAGSEWISGIGRRGRGGPRTNVDSVMSATVRVEPKTFFANERTLLQWMNTAVLLSTISITLLNFGTRSGRVAGLVMAPVAIFFICYAFWSYLRRSYSLERKEPIDYNDRLGPTVLVVCLVTALSAVIGLNILYDGEEPETPSPRHYSTLSREP